MKKFLAIGLLILCIIMLTTSIMYVILQRDYTKKIKTFQEQKDKELGISKCFVIKQYRLECMIRTLEVAYKLSKWESYYLCLIFDDFSTMYKVPWEVFPAIIRVESNFNPSAKSPADCYGFMQVKKSTGMEVAEKLGIQFNDKTLWNDIVNVIIGSTYLCTHIDKKGLNDGVKSYLGGPDFKRSVKNNHDIRNYVKEYKTSVILEYEKLALMFRGVVDELGYDYKDIYITPQETDPTPLIFTLFIDSVNIQK